MDFVTSRVRLTVNQCKHHFDLAVLSSLTLSLSLSISLYILFVLVAKYSSKPFFKSQFSTSICLRCAILECLRKTLVLYDTPVFHFTALFQVETAPQCSGRPINGRRGSLKNSYEKDSRQSMRELAGKRH